jgi:uncharacterized protein YcbK (DUF882 family)
MRFGWGRVIVVSRMPHANARVFVPLALLFATLVCGCTTTQTPSTSLSLADPAAATQELGFALPSSLAVVPSARPDVEMAANSLERAEEKQETVTVANAPAPAKSGEGDGATVAVARPTPSEKQGADAKTAQASVAEVTARDAPEPAKPTLLASASPASTNAQSQTLLSGLFKSKPKPVAAEEAGSEAQEPQRLALVDPAGQKEAEAQKVLKTISRGSGASSAALPGVRSNPDDLFEIKHRTSLSDDTDVDIEEDDGSYQVASAAGLARLAPNGLKVQHGNVDVHCLKPGLVRLIQTIERKFGRPAVISSGYRSPSYNRRVRGAKNSLHMYCAAADIKVAGVSKWSLASYLRTMPGRGGVGTYCHTDAVHIDIGPIRDWNWRCRRRR